MVLPPPSPPPGNPAGVRWTFFTFLSRIKINISLGVDCVCYYDESFFFFFGCWRSRDAQGQAWNYFCTDFYPELCCKYRTQLRKKEFWLRSLFRLKRELQSNLKTITWKNVDLRRFPGLIKFNSVQVWDLHIQRGTGLGTPSFPLGQYKQYMLDC